MIGKPAAPVGSPRRPARVAPALLTLALALTLAAPARAQDFDEPDDPPPPAQPNFNELHESNFDRWVFGNVQNNLGARDRLESLLMMSLGEVERDCRLSEAQKKKLLLAGHGDVKHFLDRVAEARRVFQRYRSDQNNINLILQETQPLAASLRLGLFGEDSFFAKTLRSTLDPDQAGRYREALRERDRFRYRAKVGLAVANLDASVGFTAEQRRRLVELTMAETTPPTKPGGPYETNVVLIKIGRLPEAKLRAIFDDDRHRLLSRQLQQARGMEVFLRNNGYLDEPGPAGPAEPAKHEHD